MTKAATHIKLGFQESPLKSTRNYQKTSKQNIIVNFRGMYK